MKVNGTVEEENKLQEENGQCGFRGLLFLPRNIDLRVFSGRQEYTLILCIKVELC
jgi:hypothetical protein